MTPGIIKIKKKSHIHFIGIGGIGVSSLAMLLKKSGYRVTGSDLAASPIIKQLRKSGISVRIGSLKGSSVKKSAQAVVYSPAVAKNNPERLFARKNKIPEYSYPEFVGMYIRDFNSICIAGTHGKSTTTTLLAHILTVAKADPSVIVGTLMKNSHNANWRKGKSDVVVVEADEYRESFLNYYPNVAILTSIERDHLDYYKGIQAIASAFQEFVSHIRPNGCLISNADDNNCARIFRKCRAKKISYGISNGQIRAIHIVYNSHNTQFSIREGSRNYRVESPLFGQHNVYNTLAAWVAARSLEIKGSVIQKALLSFKGAWRRFDIVANIGGITLIDDYAHHPTEIRACLSGIRQAFPQKKIICVFQPHHEDRLQKLFSDFSSAFMLADELFILPVYKVAGRRVKAKKNSKDLVDACVKKGVRAYAITPAHVRMLLHKSKSGDGIVFVGAGDIIDIRKRFQEELGKFYGRR